MRKRHLAFVLAVGATLLACYSIASTPETTGTGAAAASVAGTQNTVAVPASDGWTDHVADRLAEKSAALAASQERVNTLTATLAAREQELAGLRKSSTIRKLEQQEERRSRILKVYRSLKPEEAARLMDRLDEGLALEILDQMDQKTIVKLVPYLNQPRLLKWTRASMRETVRKP